MPGIDYSDFPSKPKAIDYSDFPTSTRKVDYSDFPATRPRIPTVTSPVSQVDFSKISSAPPRYNPMTSVELPSGPKPIGTPIDTPSVRPPVNLSAELKNRVQPVTSGVGQAGKAFWQDTGVGDWWARQNESRLPEEEHAPGEWLAEHLPYGGPLAKQISDFALEGTTSNVGLATLALTAGGGALLKYGGKGLLGLGVNLASKLAGKAKVAPHVYGPLTEAEQLKPENLGKWLDIGSAQVGREEQARMVSKEMSRRVQARQAVKTPGMIGSFERSGKLKGGLPVEPFKPLSETFTKKEMNVLTNAIEKSKLKPLDKESAQTGLRKILGFEIPEVGSLPEASELKFLKQVFPDMNINKKTGLLEAVADIGDVSRTITAGGDVTSFPLRQAGILTSRPAFWKAIPKGFKAWGSPEKYREVMNGVKTSKYFDLGQTGGLDITDIDDIAHTEETLASVAAKIPGISHGARAYSANANVLRQSLFDELVEKAIKQGRNLDPKSNKFEARLRNEIASYVNVATGRGSLGQFERAARGLNAVFFAPRLTASRLSIIRRAIVDPFKAPANVLLKATGRTPYHRIDPFVRKEFWRDIAAFSGQQAATLAAANYARNIFGHAIEVGNEPTSTDYGKIKIGENTRLDFNAGLQPYIRLFNQIAQRKVTSSITGKESKLGEGFRSEDAADLIGKLLGTKESPLASFFHDLARDETVVGGNVNLISELQNKFTPIILQDIVSILKEDPTLLPVIIPANFGAGLQVYGAEDIQRQPKKSKYSVTLPRIPKY